MKVSDTGVGAGFALAGAAVFASTLHYPTLDGGHPGPSLFPRILGVLMFAFGTVLAVRGVRAQDATERVAWSRLHRNSAFVNAVFVVGGTLAYLLLVERLGFLLTAPLVLFAIMARLRVRPVRAALTAVLFTLAVHLLFAKVLKVPLPTGLLWW